MLIHVPGRILERTKQEPSSVRDGSLVPQNVNVAVIRAKLEKDMIRTEPLVENSFHRVLVPT
jgi:hypothetical protein